jgi:hypothetical protein
MTTRRAAASRLLIGLGIGAWIPYFFLLATGGSPPVLPFLAGHLAGVLGGAALRPHKPKNSELDKSKSLAGLKRISQILVVLGILAWAPYVYLTRIQDTAIEMTPFLVAHLVGVLGGSALRGWIEVKQRIPANQGE